MSVSGDKRRGGFFGRAVFGLFVLSVFCFAAQAKYSGGTGEPNDPYLIATPADMNAIGTDSNDWDDHFLMTADINLAEFTGAQFNIIGNDSNHFTGVFDGNSHVIANFTYNNAAADRVGLFGYCEGEVKNLVLIDTNINVGSGSAAGSVAGRLAGTMSNCQVKGGGVTGDFHVGALVGSNWGLIWDCYAAASVTGDAYVGGLVGLNPGGTISNCYASGSVLGVYLSGYVGGLTGWNGEHAHISNCYATGDVTAGDYSSPVGGLVGTNDNSTISYCFATGNVKGDERIGGLVGDNFNGTISNCYAKGDVEGKQEVGGLTGRTGGVFGSIYYCFAGGIVDGNDYTGGFTGRSLNDSYHSCLWNNEVNPDVNGIGNETVADPNVIGKTTAQMQTKSTFTDAGWDFLGETVNGPNDIWRMCVDGVSYPKLSLEFPVADFNCPDGVDFADYSVLGDAWMSTPVDPNWNRLCDMSDPNDNIINGLDLKAFCEQWLTGF